jgi:large subunit ribosomal protein L18
MANIKKINKKKEKRVLRIRKKIKRNFCDDSVARVSVFRSSKYTTGQIIHFDGKTLFSASSRDIQTAEKKTKKEKAFEAGKILGAKLVALQYKNIIFDKGQYLYHGRVKAFAEGIKESGIIF